MSEAKEPSIPPIMRRFWPILLLFLLPLIPLHSAIFSGEAIGPFDQLRQSAPWNGPKPAQPFDVLQADGILQFYVWRDLVFDAWGKMQIPFWNPYQLAGTPLLGNSQSGALYPPHIFCGVLHLSTGTGMALLAWFHLFWAGLGVYFLCRVLGGSKVGATVGGSTFLLSSFMISWTGLPSVIETVAWIPWLLALVRLQFPPEPDGGGGIELHPLHSLAALAVCAGMMVLAGHLQFVAYGMMASAFWAVWLAVRGRQRVHFAAGGKVALGLLLGVAIAAPQLLAVLQYSQFSHRKNSATDEGYAAYTASAIQPYELIKVVAPSIQGNPRQIASDQLPVSTYYPSVLKLGANFAESAVGIGGLGLALLCILPFVSRRNDAVWGIVATGAIGLFLALGTPLNKLLYFGVPGWSSTGSPGRAVCLFVIGTCVAMGVSASRLQTISDFSVAGRQKLLKPGIAFVAVCLVFFLLRNSYELRQGLNAEIIDGLKSQAEGSAMSGCIGVILISLLAIGFVLKENSMRSKALLLAVPVLSSLAFFGASLIQTGKPDLTTKNEMGFERIAPINKSWDFFQSVHATLPPNLSALSRIHSLDGYDSLLHRDTVALLKDIDGKDAAPEVNGNMMFIKPSADLAKLADAGVTQVWSQVQMPKLDDMTQEDGLFKYKLNGPGRASTPSGPAKITDESSSFVKVEATGPGKLTLRDRNMPGWMVKVDGQHAKMEGKTWMEVDLPAGTHQIQFNYVPPGFMTGVMLAAATWLILIGMLVSARFFRTRSGVTIAHGGPEASK